MMSTFHYENSSGHNETNVYFIDHLIAAYFLDRFKDLQSDFMIRMLTIVPVMCCTETYLVQEACIDSFLVKHDSCHNTFYVVKWGKSEQF